MMESWAARNNVFEMQGRGGLRERLVALSPPCSSNHQYPSSARGSTSRTIFRADQVERACFRRSRSGGRGGGPPPPPRSPPAEIAEQQRNGCPSRIARAVSSCWSSTRKTQAPPKKHSPSAAAPPRWCASSCLDEAVDEAAAAWWTAANQCMITSLSWSTASWRPWRTSSRRSVRPLVRLPLFPTAKPRHEKFRGVPEHGLQRLRQDGGGRW